MGTSPMKAYSSMGVEASIFLGKTLANILPPICKARPPRIVTHARIPSEMANWGGTGKIILFSKFRFMTKE